MSDRKDVIQTVFIYNSFTNSGTFNYDIKLRREAYKVVVKCIDFYVDGTNNTLYLLNSSLVDGSLGYFRENKDSQSGSLGFVHQFGPYKPQQYSFTIQDGTGVNTNIISGSMMIVLEFYLV
jgi:hypothetical protein